MHEFAIIQGVFDTLEQVVQLHQLKSVSRVTLVIGSFRQIVPEFLEFAFQSVAEGTFAEGATLIIKTMPITAHCSTCSCEFSVENFKFICPQCFGENVELTAGKELYIESVEGEKQNAN